MDEILITLVFILLLSIVSFIATAVTIRPRTYFSVGIKDYMVNQTMNFESSTIASSYIIFNDPGFRSLFFYQNTMANHGWRRCEV